jgi:hypothetical protein
VNPTKPRKIIQQTAKELGVSEELVADIVYFYYGFITTVLSKLKSEQMNIDGLGIFKPRYWIYSKKINRLKAIISKTDPKVSFKNAKISSEAKDKLELLEIANDRVNKALARRNVIRYIQRNYDELI